MVLPIAFVCYALNQCAFYTPGLVKDYETCKVMNDMAATKIQQDEKVKAFQLDCLRVGTPI